MLLETIIRKKAHHLERHGLIKVKQYGFVEGKWYVANLIEFHTRWQRLIKEVQWMYI